MRREERGSWRCWWPWFKILSLFHHTLFLGVLFRWSIVGCILVSVCWPQIYKGDPRTCVTFIPVWGSIWGYSGFATIKITLDLSGVYILRFEHEDKRGWNAARCAKIVGALVLRVFFFVCVCVVGKNLKTPNLSSMADDAITWGDIGGLGSPVYICGAG